MTNRRDLAGQLLMPWADICCAGCGRKLKSEHSQQRRMGRRCWRKVKEAAKSPR